MSSPKKILGGMPRLLILVSSFALAGALVACGGGGGGGGAGPVPTRQTGEIEALGSVVVNGVRFQTTGAQIAMDGATATEDKLKVGMVVEVEGTVNADGTTGTATRVAFDDTIQGPVANPSPNGTFTAMGQEVVTVQDTEFSRAAGAVGVGATPGFNDVVADAQVEVSGAVDDLGRVVATHVQLKPAGAESEVTGRVDSANPLVVAGVTVTTGVGTTFPNFPAGTSPAVGDIVEAKGTFAGGSLAATSVELKTGLGNVNNFHFEGFVTSGDANSFVVSGGHLDQTLTVTTSGATVFAGGPRADLILGTKVEVEGNLTGGTLAATRVRFRENVRLQIVSGLASADLANIVLRNLSAVTVESNVLTRVTDASAIAGIGLNDQLEIRGRKSRDGTIIATRLRIDNAPGGNLDRVIIRGPVEAVAGSNLTLLGLTVNTAATGIVFRPNDDNSVDANELTISQAAFMAQVRTGTVVKVRGDLTADNQLTPTEIELEE
ncbi:MAG: hypothetical protein HY900_27890 [Deltaproteobacteria bacterium]|nr:hypothetical protein [Deltaproteobacteria bacterium]